MSIKPEQLEPTSTESLANLWRGQADSIMRQLDYVNAYPDAPMREVNALRQCAEQLQTWGTDSTLKGIIRKYIDDSAQKDRVDKIDDLIHLLNCERRLATLTPNQREHMNNRELSPAARAKLDEAKSEYVRDGLMSMYARSQYFRDCAWADYLNNGGTPPVFPEVKAEVSE